MLPDKPSDRSTEYTLFFRHNNRTIIEQKNFMFSPDLSAAIARGQLHCERMDLKFIKVYPAIADLELQEKKRAESIA